MERMSRQMSGKDAGAAAGAIGLGMLAAGGAYLAFLAAGIAGAIIVGAILAALAFAAYMRMVENAALNDYGVSVTCYSCIKQCLKDRFGVGEWDEFLNPVLFGILTSLPISALATLLLMLGVGAPLLPDTDPWSDWLGQIPRLPDMPRPPQEVW
jgi:hypothetical protein